MEERRENDTDNEGRDRYFMDIDRMVNEGLGGGIVSPHNGFIGDTTTDTIDNVENVEPKAEPPGDAERQRRSE